MSRGSVVIVLVAGVVSCAVFYPEILLGALAILVGPAVLLVLQLL